MLSNARLLLAQRLMKRMTKRAKQGFTLIELLVVVVIIGILASVALPSFVGAQDKARNSAVQGNTNTVRMALEQYSTDNNGSYPSSTVNTGQLSSGNYLPGNRMPRSPWGTTAQTANIDPAGNEIAASSVVAGNTMPSAGSNLGASNAAVDGGVTTQPSSTTHYGAIAYNLDAGSQTYVVYGTGKKGKSAIVGTAVSNAGQ
jgi:type IV pilus assembly protein PilA